MLLLIFFLAESVSMIQGMDSTKPVVIIHGENKLQAMCEWSSTATSHHAHLS